MGIQFASHKIIFNINYFNDTIHVDCDLVHMDFTETVIKSSELVYEKDFHPNMDNFDSELYLFNTDIKSILKKKNVNIPRRPKIANINSEYFFTETITLPKLSNIEATKSLNLELNQLYPDFNEKYYTEVISIDDNKVTNHHIKMINKKYYNQILHVLHSLKLNFDTINLTCDSLSRLMVKQNLFTRKRNSLFIDIRREESFVLSYNYPVCNMEIGINAGYNKFLDKLSKALEITPTELDLQLKNSSSILELIDKEKLLTITEESMWDVLINIKRVIGNFYVENLYDNVYLNVEHLHLDLLRDLISELFKIEFLPIKYAKNVIPSHLLDCSCVVKLRPVDYKFPKRA